MNRTPLLRLQDHDPDPPSNEQSILIEIVIEILHSHCRNIKYEISLSVMLIAIL
jgi:hypothetical protein